MIVKCSHCKQILSKNSFAKHECDVQINGCKRIDVIYFQDVSYKDKKLMNGFGVDGVLYTFKVLPRKAIPLMESLSERKGTDDFLQRKRTDKDFTEP